MNEKECGEILRNVRKFMGMTIEEMAERLDVSANTVGSWERGKVYPDEKHRGIIRSVLGVDIPERSAT